MLILVVWSSCCLIIYNFKSSGQRMECCHRANCWFFVKSFAFLFFANLVSTITPAPKVCLGVMSSYSRQRLECFILLLHVFWHPHASWASKTPRRRFTDHTSGYNATFLAPFWSHWGGGVQEDVKCIDVLKQKHPICLIQTKLMHQSSLYSRLTTARHKSSRELYLFALFICNDKKYVYIKIYHYGDAIYWHDTGNLAVTTHPSPGPTQKTGKQKSLVDNPWLMKVRDWKIHHLFLGLLLLFLHISQLVIWFLGEIEIHARNSFFEVL